MASNPIPRPDYLKQGQPYWRAGHRHHTTREGREIVLDVWRSFCAECGEPFHCGSVEGRPPQVRRCDRHKAAGKRVAGRRPAKTRAVS